MISGVIITFNPNIDRLKDNIAHVYEQVDKLFVVDNASSNQEKIREICQSKNVEFIPLHENQGLAYALNVAFSVAEKMGFEWMITLDQDSVISDDYIKKGRRYFDNKEVGIITCGYYEKNLGEKINAFDINDGYRYVDRAITSAAIVRMEAYKCTDGYDNDLFVDYVDFDFSVKIRRAGYKILYMNDVILNHELGESRKIRFLFWKIRYTEHNSKREQLIARNITIFINRYKNERILRDKLSLIKHYIFVILYDKNKKEKIRALNAGRKAGKQYVQEQRER